jgi:hypothetical protein
MELSLCGHPDCKTWRSKPCGEGCYWQPQDSEINRLRAEYDQVRAILSDRENEITRLRTFVGWVDSWVSNPVGSYSTVGLEGLFALTRDKLAELEPSS